MTDQWIPEVGEECFMRNWRNDNAWEKVKIVTANKEFGWIGFCERLQTFLNTDAESYVKPIQTETDKYRDEQRAKLASIIEAKEYDDIDECVEALYEAGCRILTDDERIVKRLTDEQIDKLTEDKDLWRDDVIAVQRELGVID